MSKIPVSKPTAYHYDLYFYNRDSMCMHYKWWTGPVEPAEFTTTEEEVVSKPYYQRHGRRKIDRKVSRITNRLTSSADPMKMRKEARIHSLMDTPLFKQLNSSLSRNQRKRKKKLLEKATKNRNW